MFNRLRVRNHLYLQTSLIDPTWSLKYSLEIKCTLESPQIKHDNFNYVNGLLPLCTEPSLCSVESTTGSSPWGPNRSIEITDQHAASSSPCCTEDRSGRQSVPKGWGWWFRRRRGELRRGDSRWGGDTFSPAQQRDWWAPWGGGTLRWQEPMGWRRIPESPIHKCTIP